MVKAIVLSVDTVIKNCKVVNPGGVLDAGLAIDKGKIVAISRDQDLPPAETIIDAKGSYAIPGLVDAHMHFEYPPGVDLASNIRAETQACAVGGCTTATHLLAPAGGMVEKAKGFVEIYENNAYIDLALSARIYTREDIKQIQRAVNYGIRGFKLLLPYRGGEAVWSDVPGIDDGIVYLTFEEIARLAKQGYNAFARVHCENVEIFVKMKETFLEQGKEPSSWNDARPRFCEEEAIRRCLYLAGITGCPLYVVHMTIKEGVDLIAKAKAEGINVIAETCPQYLALNVHNTDRVLSKVNPPIRGPEDNERLWGGIRDGVISVVATDHAPVLKRYKTNLWDALVGIGGIGTWLPVMLSEGVNKGRISLEKLVEVCCYNPARIYGLAPRKGMLLVGCDADLVVIDLEKETVVPKKPAYSLSDFSILAGWKLKGWPILTMVRGKIVAQDGKVVSKPGFGRYISAENQS